MYALINGQELILGPIAFNYRLINASLQDDLELDYRVKSSDYQSVPIEITETVKILPARDEIPDYDPRFSFLSNPSHQITDTEVIFNHEVKDKTLDQIKQERKTEIAPVRREKENQSIELTINTTKIQVSLSRENRLALASKVLGNEGPYNFKFDNTWLEVTKQDMEFIISQIDSKVQEAFDWEFAKNAEIDACQTKEEVYEVIIREQSNPTSTLRI